MRTIHITIALTLLLSSTSLAQNIRHMYPPEIPEAKVEVYKTIGDVKLNMYIFTPEDHKPSDRRAAVVFFFGGGWKSGSPVQFREHCKYLASRGMVAMAADYRVSSRHGTKAVACVADGKSAIRWVRQNAKRLGVDPDRVAAGGGSAGGHIAACTGVIKKFDESSEDESISSVPNAMVLFNPACVLAAVGDRQPFDKNRRSVMPQRMGVKPIELSPYHHVAKGAPPTIIFHGKADTTVPYWTAEVFAKAMKKAGNDCRLMGYDDQTHGFFNFGRNENKMFDATVKAMDKFFVDIGFLK